MSFRATLSSWPRRGHLYGIHGTQHQVLPLTAGLCAWWQESFAVCREEQARAVRRNTLPKVTLQADTQNQSVKPDVLYPAEDWHSNFSEASS